MKLIFKQRFFSWFDSYDIYNEMGNIVYTVKGQLSWGHRLKIFDAYGIEIGTVNKRIFSFPPKFELYMGSSYMGCISKRFDLFVPRYDIDCNGWYVEGDLRGRNYSIFSSNGNLVAVIIKRLFKITDTYEITVVYPPDALCVLMLALAIDAEKCSRRR